MLPSAIDPPFTAISLEGVKDQHQAKIGSRMSRNFLMSELGVATLFHADVHHEDNDAAENLTLMKLEIRYFSVGFDPFTHVPSKWSDVGKN